jgi:microcystin-dependent protein
MDPIIGQIQVFGFNYPPIGWAFCDGSLLSISENQPLFALIGTTYGGDGINTFALPNLSGRSMVHQGQGTGLSPMVIGQAAGQESVTLGVANLPPHIHNVSIGVYVANGEESTSTTNIAASANLYSEDSTSGAKLSGIVEKIMGNNAPLPTRSPYLAIYSSISLEGIFPSRN